jgi:hypothetical protein
MRQHNRTAQRRPECIGVAGRNDAADLVLRIQVLPLEVPEAPAMKVVRPAPADDCEIGRLREFGAVGGGVYAKLGDAFDRRKKIVYRTAESRKLRGYAVQREGGRGRQLARDGNVAAAIGLDARSEIGDHDRAGAGRRPEIQSQRIDDIARFGIRAGELLGYDRSPRHLNCRTRDARDRELKIDRNLRARLQVDLFLFGAAESGSGDGDCVDAAIQVHEPVMSAIVGLQGMRHLRLLIGRFNFGPADRGGRRVGDTTVDRSVS